MEKRKRSKKNYRFALYSRNGLDGVKLIKKFSLFDKARNEGLQLINDELEMNKKTSTCSINAISNEIENDTHRCMLTITVCQGEIIELFNF